MLYLIYRTVVSHDLMYVMSSVQDYVAKNLSLSEQFTLRLLAYLKMSRCDFKVWPDLASV